MDIFEAIDHLTNAEPASVYLLHGSEMGLFDWFCDALLQTSHFSSLLRFDYEEDGFEPAEIELCSFSLFGDRPLVYVRNATVFTADGRSGAEADRLAAYLEQPMAMRTLVLSVASDKLDERRRVTKLAKRHAVISCSTPSRDRDALRMLERLAKAKEVLMEHDALTELWRRTQSLTLAVNEFGKLQAYAGGRPIARQDVEELVPMQVDDSVFTWIDWAVQGQVMSVFNALDGLARQGYDAFALIALLARQVRLMALAKGARNIEQRAKEFGVHPYALRMAARQAGAFRQKDLARLVRVLADAEFDVKRGRLAPDIALHLALMELTRAASTAQKNRAQ
ncbi:DNA polymerase III subunit delta [Alicyclobacillus vulcanalis]|uniref:DNA polymerase III subunit delta n=1 Tax=Alicyclobacillus vulcanalis TaxID=252246 RepID=A0A1N7KZT8_9BACL|nr:DNA polymerase III subunit delta [Alicyclobacillus vulcanalis]SIS67081.1 DNA polymerase III, delta subunit [Alicyclobacillus vulcanalis]